MAFSIELPPDIERRFRSPMPQRSAQHLASRFDRPVAQSPYPQKGTAAIVKRLLKVHELETGQHPGKTIETARLKQDRYDSIRKTFLLKRKEQLPLHPHRLHGM